jgi:hypothetical protein
MKPYIHAKNSVKRYGGAVEDYMPIHDWFDSTKAAYADFGHRAVLHHTFGIFLCEQVFGKTITNSDGKIISVRDVAEDHVKEDCGGKIPTIEDWMGGLEPKPWMLGKGQKAFAKHMGLEAD